MSKRKPRPSAEIRRYLGGILRFEDYDPKDLREWQESESYHYLSMLRRTVFLLQEILEAETGEELPKDPRGALHRVLAVVLKHQDNPEELAKHLSLDEAKELQEMLGKIVALGTAHGAQPPELKIVP